MCVMVNDLGYLGHVLCVFTVAGVSDLGNCVLEVVLELSDVLELANVSLELFLVCTFELRP